MVYTSLHIKNAKAPTIRISDTYRSFEINAAGFGTNYGTQTGVTQPIIVPAVVLGHHSNFSSNSVDTIFLFA